MPRQVLVVDDLPVNRRILSAMLCSRYDVLEAASGEAALKLLDERPGQVSAVLLDVVMPGMDGFEVLRRMREDKRLSALPVVLITGSEDENVRIRALAAGAADFVMKPYKPDVILHCLKNNIALFEASAAASAAQRDRLTGLYNREAFFDRVSEAVAEHEPGYYIMACFDIDRFKVINDQYGTVKGDGVLRHVAQIFREGFTPNGGICCRVSSDNFAVLYPASFRDSAQIADIRNRAAHIEGLVTPIIFSIGRYLVDDLSLAPVAMYDRASMAAESVKGQYGGKIANYDESMREKLNREQEIILEMSQALKDRQFEVWFQPLYNYATEARIGAEALVRWRHPAKGLIPPGEFIPLFEQNGFVYEVDKFVWEEVCRYLRQWLDEGRNPLPVSVNISRYDVFQPDLMERLTGLMERYRLPVALLRLEITESAFSESPKYIIEVVRQLIDKGFTVEIDDFGSGYSSLNTLKDVPAQILKLDMKFLESSADSRRGGNIVESVVRMAKWLDMSVIAEGVETRQQADYLLSIGCSYMQGYLFARPMPAGEYVQYCCGTGKEEHLLALETVENLDNNSFWDPESMDTLIFNSYVGGACIFEYNNGSIELLRATEKYAEVIGSAGMTVEDALKLDWAEHLDDECRARVIGDLQRSIATRKETTAEYVFLDLPGCPHETYLRSTMRVIASAGSRYLVYCTNENITAQREAELRERETSEEMRLIMANVNSGICASVRQPDGSFHIIFANERFYSMYGYTREQMETELGSVVDAIHPDDYEKAMATVNSLMESGGRISYRYRCIRRDGSVITVSCNNTVTTFPGIGDAVLLAVVYDVTEQVEAEQRIQSLNEQVSAIMRDIESGLTATVVRNGKVEVLFSNEQFFRMRGYTRESYHAQVKDYYEFVYPEDKERLRLAADTVYTAHRPIREEYRVILADGSVRWMRVNMTQTRFTGVEEPVALSVFSDVTAEKNAELATREVAEQLQSIMDDMPGGFARLRLSPEGGLKPDYVNEGFCRIANMSHEEVMRAFGEDSYAGIYPEDVPMVREKVAEMLEKRELIQLRCRILCSDGYMWMDIACRISTDKQGGVYLNSYYSDAGDRLRDEERMREILDNLPCGAGVYELANGQMSLIYQNDSYWELVGLNEADFPDTEAMSAIHPDDVPVIMQELGMAMQQQRGVSCDIRLRHLTMGYRPVHLSARVVAREDMRFVIYATFTPISGEGMPYQQMLPLLLSAIMEFTSDLAFAKDTQFRYISASNAFAAMAGKDSAREIIGKTDYELFDREIADKFRSDDAALLESDSPMIDMVEPIPAVDGVPHYSSTSKYLLRDGFGKPVGIYGVGRDVTQSMAQETRLRLLADTIPGGLAAYLCTEGDFSAARIKLVYFNDGFCRLFGCTREEYMEQAVADPAPMVIPEDRHMLAQQWENLMTKGTPINCLYRAHVKGGGFKWINHRAVAADRKGDAVLINAVLQDVTEQREAIEQLRLSEAENRLAVKLGGSAVARFIIADRSLSLTPEVAEAYSLPVTIGDVPEEPIRLGLVAPESADACRGFFNSIIQGSQAASAIFKLKYLGRWCWMEAKSSTIFSEDRPIKAVIAFTDVTERLEKESVFKRWQQSLQEKDGAAYTLYRCNLSDIAQSFDEKGSLISFRFDKAGDDFRQRAQAYAKACVHEEDREGYAQFTDPDKLLDQYYRGHRSDSLEYRELLPEGGERWLRLTVDLVEQPTSTQVEAYLLYEDIDKAKRNELHTRELAETDPLTGVLNRTAFAAKVDERIRASRPELRHAMLMLDIDGFKQVNDVFGHGAGDQALEEIANNLRSIVRREDMVARIGGDEFMLFLSGVQDESSVAVKAQKVCDMTRRAFSLEVQISGSVGIAMARRDGTDFETLYRKADSALYHVKGSGKNNFVFYSDNMSDEILRPEADSSSMTGQMLTEKKRRMLVVDDSDTTNELLRSIFKDEFITEKAKDGASALIRLRHYGSAISVVLLDLNMPGMDGFAVLEQMQQSAEMSSIPVLIVSGDESRETCLRAVRAGASDYITKPVDPDLLRLRVRSAVSRSENDRLRAQNRLLEAQNQERERMEAAFESAGIACIELDWLKGEFMYHPSVGRYLLGCFDRRKLWQILLADRTADAHTVQRMQQFVHSVAEDRAGTEASIVVELKTPEKKKHRFRMNVRKLTDKFQPSSRLIIALSDLEPDELK